MTILFEEICIWTPPSSRGKGRVKLAFYMRSAGAYIIWLFGERVERGQGKNVVSAIVPASQETSGAQGNNYTNFLFVLLHTQFLLPKWQ